MLRLCLLSVVAFCVVSDAVPDCSKPHPKADLMSCCRMPASLKELIDKCNKKFPEIETRGFCHGQCMFEVMGLFSDGKILSEKVPSVIDALFKSSGEFLPIAISAHQTCHGMSNKYVPMLAQKFPEEATKCHPLPAFMAGCFMTDAFLKCPASMWDTDSSCNGAKEYLEKCVVEQELQG